MDRNGKVLRSTLFLDQVGEVAVTLDPDVLSWKPLNRGSVASSCLCMKRHSKIETEIKFSNVYAVEFIDRGLIHGPPWNCGGFLLGSTSEMYRFVVHGFHKPETCCSPWVLSEYTFGHEDLQKCQMWVEDINAYIKIGAGRPKSLLVFVHPLCGKGRGNKTWEMVAPIFSRAKVQTEVKVTKRAGHAFDIISSLSDGELCSFDGIVAVGGDGLFNEVLNGLLSSRHKVPYPPAPTEFNYSVNDEKNQMFGNNSKNNGRACNNDENGLSPETSSTSDDREPLLSTSESTNKCGPCNTDQNPAISFPNDWFRLGIIPAGSTDAIVISTTGMRDPVTSALHIIFGKSMSLDIAQVVRWKTSPSSMDLPYVRYAASFAGYGFYGDVIKESEKYRWMGPVRYDFAGTKVFLEHRSYEAEIAFLETEKFDPLTGITDTGESKMQSSRLSGQSSNKVICRMNCTVCNEAKNSGQFPSNRAITSPNVHSENSRWLQSKGRFISVGAAIISCRNERSPDGLVADAHLADGFLHLILVKDCPRPYYLWHLMQLTRSGSNPLNFDFVEHHKTPAFTFVSSHDESVWNLDGEILQACQVSVQVCRGLVNLFASGPEV
ncbi:ceramide kinase [Cocos nucifera]|uniref:Ceramide kinase n=1 Tax=Cocos nucifera TaxID=13894 RepID=A0A8K0ILA8_COCNU|nr:ceramide kinase [Cocos nucifera]